MMKNYDESVEMNHNPNWPYIPDRPYGILIIGGSGSGKPNRNQELIKFIYMSEINPNQSISYSLTEKKK